MRENYDITMDDVHANLYKPSYDCRTLVMAGGGASWQAKKLLAGFVQEVAYYQEERFLGVGEIAIRYFMGSDGRTGAMRIERTDKSGRFAYKAGIYIADGNVNLDERIFWDTDYINKKGER